MSTPFGTLKRVDAGVLNLAYAAAGPADGPVVRPNRAIHNPLSMAPSRVSALPGARIAQA
jgi:hypothetical protein